MWNAINGPEWVEQVGEIRLKNFPYTRPNSNVVMCEQKTIKKSRGISLEGSILHRDQGQERKGSLESYKNFSMVI